MTKDELIAKLNEFPNLPVVVELDCDTLRSKDVENIEIKKVVKTKYDDYDDNECNLEETLNDVIEVIWIS